MFVKGKDTRLMNKWRYCFGKTLRRLGIGFDAEKNEAVENMLKTIAKLENRKIKIVLEFDKDGNWSAEAENLPGLITGGNLRENDNINEMIIDAIFTYFAIPPEYCDEAVFSKSKRSNKTKVSASKTYSPYLLASA